MNESNGSFVATGIVHLYICMLSELPQKKSARSCAMPLKLLVRCQGASHASHVSHTKWTWTKCDSP